MQIVLEKLFLKYTLKINLSSVSGWKLRCHINLIYILGQISMWSTPLHLRLPYFDNIDIIFFLKAQRFILV